MRPFVPCKGERIGQLHAIDSSGLYISYVDDHVILNAPVAFLIEVKETPSSHLHGYFAFNKYANLTIPGYAIYIEYSPCNESLNPS